MKVAIRPFSRSPKLDMISGLVTFTFAVALAVSGGPAARTGRAGADAAGPPSAEAEAPARTAASGPREGSAFQAEYLHSLSTNFGKLPFSEVMLSYDPVHREVFVTGDGPVRVFNESGMEVFAFRDASELSAAMGVAPVESGDLLALLRRASGYALQRFTFRGEPMAEIVPRNVPAPYTAMMPGIMRYANHRIYLCDGTAMRILVLDDTGEYVASYDVAEKMGEAENRENLGLRGFGVDAQGNMLFTVQPLFRAYVMTSDGQMTGFGQRGSAPGKFNVVGGIARDAAGNFYVADLLKSAILVFGPDLRWVKEFGYRGTRPGSLVVPEEIVIGGEKLFVSNRGKRGVSVFHVGL